ncbi:vacuolar membrane-associated protein iml1 [Gonapodya sp. JEL0774]|nr:vacuolar membrane-associated protein iml1 [Gonapodya sp. JEL0774]
MSLQPDRSIGGSTHFRSKNKDLVINPEFLPGISESDVLEIIPVSAASGGQQTPSARLLLKATRVDLVASMKQPNLQVSVERSIASAFNLRPFGDVLVKKVETADVTLDYVEIAFKDQYFGRADMWRLRQAMDGTCVFRGRRLNHFTVIKASVNELYVKGKVVDSGVVSSSTKAIFRSESAKVYIFIQMSKEMWHFDEDGELYREKCLSGLLPELYARWRAAGANHLVTIVLTTRVFYPQSTDPALVTLNHIHTEPRTGRLYRDFYSVVVDFESRCEWLECLRLLKIGFAKFERDVLQVAREDGSTMICGENSAGFEGNVLEAVNLALNPFDRHYVDRDLLRTGLSIIVVTPTPGFFDCRKDLLRLTTQRMMDHGLGLDVAEDRLRGAQHGGPEDVLTGTRFMFRCRMHSVQVGLQQRLEQNVLVPVEMPPVIAPAASGLLLSGETNKSSPARSPQRASTTARGEESTYDESIDDGSASLNDNATVRDWRRGADTGRGTAGDVKTSAAERAISISDSVYDEYDEYDEQLFSYVEISPSTKNYEESPYTVSPSMDYQDGAERKRAESLFVMELVLHRLGQGFQLHSLQISPTDDGYHLGPRVLGARPSLLNNEEVVSTSLKTKSSNLTEGLLWSKDSRDRGYLLSLGDHIHRIIPSNSGAENVAIKRYVKKSKLKPVPIIYPAVIRPKNQSNYKDQVVSFSYSPLAQHAWNYVDRLIAGYIDDFKEDLRFWRTRFLFLPTDSLPSVAFIHHAGLSQSEKLNDEEIRIAAFQKFIDQFEKAILHDRPVSSASIPTSKTKQKPPASVVKVDFTTYNLSKFVEVELNKLKAGSEGIRDEMREPEDLSTASPWPTVLAAMHSPGGVAFKDRTWHITNHQQTFIGREWVDWAVRVFSDIETREEAVTFGRTLMEKNLIAHCRGTHSFLDGQYWYIVRKNKSVDGERLKLDGAGEVATPAQQSSASPSKEPTSSQKDISLEMISKSQSRSRTPKIQLSRRVKVDMDPHKRSERSEWVHLHFDTIQNMGNAYHFQLNWDNPFGSVAEVSLAVPPPAAEDVRARVSRDLVIPDEWFERELLRSQGFILDLEAGRFFPERSVEYSHGGAVFDYTQFIHKSGVAFVQILDQGKGFHWVSNRLILASSSGSPSQRGAATQSSDELLKNFKRLCEDPKQLSELYERSMAKLPLAGPQEGS